MYKKSVLLFSLILGISIVQSPALNAQDMNNDLLHEILIEMSDSISGDKGYWELLVRDIPMLCITDENHNRMRIITPVSELTNLKKGQLKSCMEANFHSVLDVKYAISDDYIWVAFIHPLKELSKDQLRDAISQVWSAAYTFGTAYSSTDLVFPDNSKKKNTKKM